MQLTDEHYAAAVIIHECELAGTPVKEMASRIGVSRQTLYNWFRDPQFVALHKGQQKNWERRISHITLTYRRARLEKLDAMARDPKESSSIVLRALKQIADETAADIEGMLGDLVDKIEQLERPMAEDTVPPELANE